MAYLVLARKYRPQNFSDVVGQAHVTRTLTNAIRAERVAHAILFAGPRGTGKTTIARILAKSMNCERGPAPAPCNECRSCREITGSHATDVLEIDGASNNGVDHIRDLRENIRYMPAHSRFKIYIIDEVHMLSTAAFNALLKTLEEPPAHVMFLFATTEPHKIPITILSRCQRHDLRRIETGEVASHMADLCRREEIAISEESLSLIARETGGSMRDALSLLDHVMACAEGEVDHKQVLDILGVVDRDVIFRLADAILGRDVSAALALIDEVYDHGHNLKELYAALLEHFRNLLVVRMGRDAAGLVDATEQERRRMAESVRRVSETHLGQLLDVLFREEATIRYSSQPRIALEMACFRMFQLRPSLPIETLIEKLDGLSRGVLTEAELERPDPLDLPPAPVRPEISAPGQAGGAESGSAASSSPETPREPAPSASPDPDPVRPAEAAASVPSEGLGEEIETPPAPADRQEVGYSAADSGDGHRVSEDVPPTEAAPAVEAPLDAAQSMETGSAEAASVESMETGSNGEASSKSMEAVSAEAAPGESAGNGSTAEDRDVSGESAESVRDQTAPPASPNGGGEAILERAAARASKSISSVLRKCRIASVSPGALELEINASDFHLNRLKKQERTLRTLFSEAAGGPVRLTLKKGKESGGPASDRAAETNRRKEEALNHPLVSAAMEIFEGTLQEVKLLSEE